MKKMHDQLLVNIAVHLENYKSMHKAQLKQEIIHELAKSSALHGTFYRFNSNGFNNLQHALEVAANDAPHTLDCLRFIAYEVYMLFKRRSAKQHRTPELFYGLMVEALNDISIAFSDRDYKHAKVLLANTYDHIDKNYTYHGYKLREDAYFDAHPLIKKFYRDYEFYVQMQIHPELMTQELKDELHKYDLFVKEHRFSMANKLRWFCKVMLDKLNKLDK